MRDAHVDLAVFEVGLGGRLDATNVIPPPRCAVITSIGRDHTRLLGEEPASIAREKAGIVKPGAPLVVGAMADEARDAILEIARDRGAGPITVVARSPDDAGHLAGRDVDVVLASEEADGLELRGAVDIRVPRPALVGPHQRKNAAAAAAAAARLDGDLTIGAEAIADGIASARWPGRLERFDRDGVTILLDCAHNVDAAQALDAALGPTSPEHTHLVFGALGDKGWPEMLRLLGPHAAHRYYCTPLSELAGRKPAPPAELARIAPGRTFPTKEEAVDAAIDAARPGDVVIVTGSIFLVGSVRSHLTGTGPDPAVPL
jgi:dihydrofolate synthase/folylpolyglutamate synthase